MRQSDYTFRCRCDREWRSATLSVAAAGRRQRKGKGMSDSDEFVVMSDPDFLAERKRVRETLEALTERYRLINIEFDRRAGVSWATAGPG
jgi:hypothetical protein